MLEVFENSNSKSVDEEHKHGWKKVMCRVEVSNGKVLPISWFEEVSENLRVNPDRYWTLLDNKWLVIREHKGLTE